MDDVVVVLPVGPGDIEAARCVRLVQGISAWEPSVSTLIVIDDDGADRGLLPRLTRVSSAKVVVLPHPLGRREAVAADRIAVAVLAGLRHAVDETSCGLVLKLDTDAAVIAPFADRLKGAFVDDPAAGLAGSYTITCNGEARDFGPLVDRVRRVHDRRLARGRARTARRFVREARARGYEWGEHALACAIAMPRELLVRLRRDEALDDPTVFLGTGLGDDPVLGILVRRAGMQHINHTAAGETIAVAWRGLPSPLEELIARGYALVHSVKNDPNQHEAALNAQVEAHASRAPAP